MAVHNPYPVRSGNTFRLLAGADELIPAMLQAIGSARRYVLFEQYLVSSGEIAERFIIAFADCAQRGIPVYMLLDHFGSRKLMQSDRQRIRKAGVHLAFYNPACLTHFLRGLPRNHAKLLLIDGEIAYTGGAGITDNYRADGIHPAWFDILVEMRGPILQDWQHMFERTWQRWCGDMQLPPVHWPANEPSGEPPDGNSAGQRGQLSLSLRGLKKFIRKSLLFRIRHASNRIWLATAYWLPGRTILRALRAARRRDADVRLLLPGPINDHTTVYHAGRRYYHFLLRHGVRIFEYQPAFMHAKLYLCDRWVSLGSCNMDRWGLRWNLEANLESDDAALCTLVEARFEQAFAQSQEITLATWLQRPVGNRFREWLFGYLDLILERLGISREASRRHARVRKSTATDRGGEP